MARCKGIRKHPRLLLSAAAVLLVLASMTGCFKEDSSYTIPEDIYGVSLERRTFKPLQYTFSDSSIASGRALSRNDFQVNINANLVLRLGDAIDTSALEYVKEYAYGDNGSILEYKESTGNYKVLVTEYEGKHYLLGFLSISKYVYTPRNVRNGMQVDDLDYQMGNIAFITETSKGQESRVYSLDRYKLVVTSKDGIVRSIQLLYDI